MPSLEQLTNQLKLAFENKDYTNVDQLLTPIKVLLIENDLLIPNQLKFKDSDYINDLIISRSILEIGAISSINLKDFIKFSNYVSQLKVFYFNSVEELNKSIKKNKILSLYLLLLLSNGDIVKFHQELEFLTYKIPKLDSDLYLSYPINIKNWLLIGDYEKAISNILNESSEVKIKLKEFNIFNETLLNTIRLEISESIKNSYKSLPFLNAKYLLFFANEKEVEIFAIEQGWSFDKNVLYFKQNDDVVNEDNNIDQLTNYEKLVKNTLNYAKEIDSII
ncbi:hypothetical protein WICMUC_001675 [Wickerhamomyces mucosus]|uniref:PCI domain-containing protein n=1 Tax=Wickerhamomyces mucosus TaxID=1378264 RepID=A0A9P8TH29_9ASCO|nr:hypothetical protein WICMUC_001675 [Wickerhamomyces mucosus]